jgi:hypothetical protein
VSIEWFRDLVIIIWGLGSTVVILIIGVLAIMFYRRMRPALDSLKTTTKTVETITSVVSENVVGPLSKVVAFVQGARQAVNFVSQLRNKKEED